MAKTMRLSRLKKQYEIVVSEYVQKFCNKQGLEFEGWVADDIGGVACFGDIFFYNLKDIIWDVNSNQPKGLIIQWLYDCCDNPEKAINYFNYSKGLRFSDLA